jgi:hypothetical protein
MNSQLDEYDEIEESVRLDLENGLEVAPPIGVGKSTL